MLKEIIDIPNGDFYVERPIYLCDKCMTEFEDSNPHYVKENKHYCWGCSFLKGFITEKEYLKWAGGVNDHMFRAYIEDDEIKIKFGKYTPEELRLRRNKRARENYKRNQKVRVVK